MKGFVEEKVVFFPDIKFRNVRGSKVWWNFRDFLQLHPADQPPSQLSTVAALTLSVCTEMERQSLAYSRTMEKYRDASHFFSPATCHQGDADSQGFILHSDYFSVKVMRKKI